MHNTSSPIVILLLLSELSVADSRDRSEFVDYEFDSLWEEHLLPTIQDGFDQTGYSILTTGALFTVISHNQDNWVRKEWRGEQKVSRGVTEFGAVWGSGGPSVVIAGALLYFDPRSGMAFTESIFFTSLSHFAISRLSGRRRPGNPLTRTSFPSGHTANAWAMATSLSYLYGWKLAVPAYSAAILTMAARIADDRHWLSDTIAASALGAFWGRAAYIHHADESFRFQPILSAHSLGLEFSYDF